MKITTTLSCLSCRKQLEKTGSVNDPSSVFYECPKCGIKICQEFNVNTGLTNWQKKQRTQTTKGNAKNE